MSLEKTQNSKFTELAESINPSDPRIQVLKSKEYGASTVSLSFARKIDLDRMISAEKVQWREDILALIVGGILHPSTELLPIHSQHTMLWESCGHTLDKKTDLKKWFFRSLERLLSKQESIQKKLCKKNLKDGCAVLYDLPSWNLRDVSEKLHIGILSNLAGCPFGIEFFPDKSSETIQSQVDALKSKFKVNSVILIGNWYQFIKNTTNSDRQDFRLITALSHLQIRNLIKKNIITSDHFSQDPYQEVVDPVLSDFRYVLYFNNKMKRNEGLFRNERIKKTNEQLTKFKFKNMTQGEITSSIQDIFALYDSEKYFICTIREGSLEFSLNHLHIQREEQLDGRIVIQTNVENELLSPLDILKAYQILPKVNETFTHFNTLSPEGSHQFSNHLTRQSMFLHLLTYYLQWHMMEKLEGASKKNTESVKKNWTFSAAIEKLKAIRSQTIQIENTILNDVISTLDDEQSEIASIFGIKL